MTNFELVFMQWAKEVFGFMQPVARILTEFGGEAFIFLLVAILYFAVSKDKGERLAVTVTASSCVNGILKTAVRRPRPFMLDESLAYKGLAEHYAETYSFPSGHAQNGAAAYTTLMLLFKSKWVRALAVVAMIVVPLTRVVLGVHFPTDILIGTAIGVCFAILFAGFLDKIWHHRDRWYLGFAAAAILTIFVVYFPISLYVEIDVSGKAFGAFSGIMIGFVLEHRYGRMEDTPVCWKKLVRLLLLFAFLAAVFFSLDALLGLAGEHFTLDFAKYFLTIGSAMGVIPLCVRKLKI